MVADAEIADPAPSLEFRLGAAEVEVAAADPARVAGGFEDPGAQMLVEGIEAVERHAQRCAAVGPEPGVPQQLSAEVSRSPGRPVAADEAQPARAAQQPSGGQVGDGPVSRSSAVAR